MKSSSTTNVTIASLVLCLGFWSCRKDPKAEPNAPAPVEEIHLPDCEGFLFPELIQADTIIALNSVFGEQRYIYFDAEGSPSLSLHGYGSFVYAWGHDWLSVSVVVTGYSADSIGVFIPPMLVSFTPRSFQIGDTLDPFSPIQPRVELYFSDDLAGVMAIDPPPVWYVGFVKIIDGKKHAGYVRIGTSVRPGQHLYWLEYARLSLCPGSPIVITE